MAFYPTGVSIEKIKIGDSNNNHSVFQLVLRLFDL